MQRIEARWGVQLLSYQESREIYTKDFVRTLYPFLSSATSPCLYITICLPVYSVVLSSKWTGPEYVSFGAERKG